MLTFLNLNGLDLKETLEVYIKRLGSNQFKQVPNIERINNEMILEYL